jgi:TPR repeat protein
MVEHGSSTMAQSHAEAFKLYKKAAYQGNMFAQCNVGTCFLYGHGVDNSDSEAARWFKLAADQGYAMAQCNLGFLFAKGRAAAV